MNPLDAWFEALPSGHRETLLFLRKLLTAPPHCLEERYAWRIPVYYRNDRYLCYLYHEAKRGRSYLAFVRATHFVHPLLRAEGRKQIRILQLDPDSDVPVEAIEQVLAQALAQSRNAH